KLSGMTGTAVTEQEEFVSIYGLDIIEIPTNKPVIRIDDPDVVYKNETGKNRAIIEQIVACHAKGQPVLVGTVSIEKSEYLSKLLKARGIPHTVLNAKYHEKEAEIVAQAGKLGAVTIATNMAGRGTDIMLGGNAEFLARQDLRKAGYSDEIIAEATGYAETADEEILAARALFAEKLAEHKKVTSAEAEQVRAAGGLFILGTERHESRRIDNQLRGRAGRQGDPGESRFYLAMTDDIMRLFGSERIMGMMETLKLDDDTPLDAKLLSNSIEQAQKTVESRNFQTRKSVLEYDDVMNKQREIIYGERSKVLDGEDLRAQIMSMIREFVHSTVLGGLGGAGIESQEQLDEVLGPLTKLFVPKGYFRAEEYSGRSGPEKLVAAVTAQAEKVYALREEAFGPGANGAPLMRELERVIMLRVVDEYWMDHIDAMSELKRGIGLRGYGATKPIDAYKQEGFDMFEAMVAGIREETVRRLFIVQIRREQQIERKAVAKNAAANVGGEPVKKKPVKKAPKPGRNDPCPCGKMKADGSRRLKYKECCGRNE
ncbi:MAG: preprotein translocase subunit SecA, partial [Oscillospiraceae bacterium]|nr:preprotein translocase subunit SecA [Oscillospiraceae bacterium]